MSVGLLTLGWRWTINRKGGVATANVRAWVLDFCAERNTTIQDVVDQVVYFCRAETVTGRVLLIDGGIHFY